MARPQKYLWNQEQAKRVEALSGYGLKGDQIAKIEKMSESTLQRLYQAELTEGRELAISAVSQTAYRMAKDGKVPSMTMFWLKTQARWKEVHEVQHSTGDGGFKIIVEDYAQKK